jgi:hypothetical protein
MLLEPGMVVHTYDPSPQEAEGGGSIVQGQPGLYNKTLSQTTATKMHASKNLLVHVYWHVGLWLS